MSDLRAGTPVTVSDVTIIPIEKTLSRSFTTKQGFWMYSSKNPVALVFCGPRGSKAVDIAGRDLRLEELVHKVPGLEAILRL